MVTNDVVTMARVGEGRLIKDKVRDIIQKKRRVKLKDHLWDEIFAAARAAEPKVGERFVAGRPAKK